MDLCVTVGTVVAVVVVVVAVVVYACRSDCSVGRSVEFSVFKFSCFIWIVNILICIFSGFIYSVSWLFIPLGIYMLFVIHYLALHETVIVFSCISILVGLLNHYFTLREHIVGVFSSFSHTLTDIRHVFVFNFPH